MSETTTKPAHHQKHAHVVPKDNSRVVSIMVVLLLGVCIGATSYLLLHLAGKLGAMGQNGSNIAQIWSFIVAILELLSSVAATIIAIWLQKKSTDTPTLNDPAVPPKKTINLQRMYSPKYIALGLVAAVIAFVVPPAINSWAFQHVDTENVTSRVQLSGNTLMSDGDTAYVKLPQAKHKKLKITFRLISQESTGSCVAPARMQITPTYNGNEGKTIGEVGSGTPQSITLGDMTQPAQLSIYLTNDPYCKVKIIVDSAVYYN